MPTSIPRSVRQAWGEEAAEDFARWFDQTLHERAVPRDEYREVLSRLDVLEHRMETLEQGQAEQRRETLELRREMNARFDAMNERFDKMNERFDQLRDQMLVMTRWAIGLLALFATAVTALLAIAQFTG